MRCSQPVPHHCLTPKNKVGNIFIWSHSLLGNAHIYFIPRDQGAWLTMTKWNGAKGLFSSPSVTSQRADSAGHLVQLKNWLTPDTGFQILPPFSKATCSNTGVYCYMTMQMSSALLPCKSVQSWWESHLDCQAGAHILFLPDLSQWVQHGRYSFYNFSPNKLYLYLHIWHNRYAPERDTFA